MYLHANAKLGLAGRFALVEAVAGGCSIRGAARRFNVSPATAHRWWHRWLEAGAEARGTLSCLFDRSSRPRRCPRQLGAQLEEAICACRRQTGWGPRLVAGATGHPALDGLEGAETGRDLAAAAARKGAGRRYEWPAPAICCTWTRAATPASCGPATPGHRRPLATLAPLDEPRARVGYDYAHAIVDDHSRLAYVELHTDEQAADRDRLRRTRSRLLRQARDRRETADDRQRLELRQEPQPARAPRRQQDQASDNEALSAANERQGRTLPPNDGTRMGLRAPLPLITTPRPGAATLARALQHAQTTQLNRRPATDQPRSQRLWVGQLAARPGSLCMRAVSRVSGAYSQLAT